MDTVSCVLCLECGTLLPSTYRHDFRTCDCPNSAMNDGGDSYGRYGAMNVDQIIVGRFNIKTNQFEETKNE